MRDAVFPDTTVLRSFAAAGALPTLRAFVADSGRIVEAVDYELQRSAAFEPGLLALNRPAWFGTPIRIENEAEQRSVERFRVQRFGGLPSDPLKHLGESQTLVVMERAEFEGALWLTDDRGAYRVAQHQEIPTMHTVEVLQALIRRETISLAMGMRIESAMLAAGRHLLGGLTQRP